ncbi:2347_t:CDS:2, partial [Diversispora eburnea]
MFVDTLVEGKTPVKALINTSLKFNTISKRLFDKLEEDYRLEGVSGDDLIDGTEVIDFQICKNPSFDLVLGQKWLWMHKVKIIFGFSSRTYEHRDKIVIDNMSIPLIEGDGRPMDNSKSHKTSSGKNNSSNLVKSKAGLIKDEITNMINKILSDVENNKRLDNDVPKNSRVSKNKKYPKVDLGDGCGKLSLKTYLNNIWKSVHSIENDIYYGIFKRLSNIENELRGPSNSRSRQNKSKKGGVKYSMDSDTDTSDTSTSYSFNSGSKDVSFAKNVLSAIPRILNYNIEVSKPDPCQLCGQEFIPHPATRCPNVGCRYKDIETSLTSAINETRSQDPMEISPQISMITPQKDLTSIMSGNERDLPLFESNTDIGLTQALQNKEPPLHPKVLLNQLLKYAPNNLEKEGYYISTAISINEASKKKRKKPEDNTHENKPKKISKSQAIIRELTVVLISDEASITIPPEDSN